MKTSLRTKLSGFFARLFRSKPTCVDPQPDKDHCRVCGQLMPQSKTNQEWGICKACRRLGHKPPSTMTAEQSPPASKQAALQKLREAQVIAGRVRSDDQARPALKRIHRLIADDPLLSDMAGLLDETLKDASSATLLQLCAFILPMAIDKKMSQLE